MINSMRTSILLLVAFFLPIFIFAQTDISIVAAELHSPVGIEVDADNNVWVAESGSGQDDGAVTVIWADGTVERVIDSLPSFFDAETNETAGPLRAQMINERYLAVFISETNDEYASSLLIYERDSIQPGRDALGVADALNAVNIGEQVLGRLGFAESNPYSLLHNGCDMMIADAAANSILRRDGLTGVIEVFAELPSQANPLPFGPPFYEPVPTRLLRDGEGGFLVSQLTGFPFVDNGANIYSISAEGEVSVRDSNLTLVTDMRHHPSGDGLLALQFAQFRGDSLPPFVFNSAMITHLKDDGSRDTIASGFGPSPGMAVASDGGIYVTHLFLGMVMRIDALVTDVKEQPVQREEPLRIFPNPAGNETTIGFNLEKGQLLELEVFDVAGRRLYRKDLGYRPAGEQQLRLDLTEVKGAVSNVYFVRVSGAGKYMMGRLISE